MCEEFWQDYEDFKDILTEEEREEIRKLIRDNTTNVIEAIQNKVGEKLDTWKTVTLRCGITGDSGTGKSSFINAVRGLKPKDEKAAPVDNNQTTMQPTEYPDPKNPNLVYVDLPGVGTPEFPPESYLEKIEIESYDFFLIVTATRFTSNDIWLATEIRRLEKSFFFVRTKMDTEYRNAKRDHGLEKHEVDQKIQGFTTKLLTENNFDNNVYLISNPYPENPQFPELLRDIRDALNRFKRDAAILSMKAFSKEMISEKKKALRKRIYLISLLSATVGATPIVGVSGLFDIAIIMHEIGIYREQFGLLDEDLRRYDLTAEMLKTLGSVSSKEGIVLLLEEVIKRKAKQILVQSIPVVGSIIGFGASFSTTYALLRMLLNKLESIAYDIMKIRFREMIEDMDRDM